MNWHAFILLTVLSHSVATIFFRAVAREKQADRATFAVGAVQSVIVLSGLVLFLPFIGGIKLDAFYHYAWWFILGGTAQAMANAAIYKVFTHLEAGIANILSLLNVVFVTIFGAIILHEYLSAWQYVGAMLILTAVIYATHVARHPKLYQRHKKGWAVGLGFALLGGFISGASLVNQKFLIDHVPVPTFLFFMFLFQTLALAVFAVGFQRHMFKFAVKPRILKFNLINGWLRSFAALFGVLAVVKSNNIVLMTMIENSKMILVIILAAIFLHEREQLPQKFVAAVIASLGLGIIFIK